MSSTATDAPPPGGADDDGRACLPRPREEHRWQPLAPGALGADPTTDPTADPAVLHTAEADGLFEELPPLPLSGPLADALTAARTAVDDAVVSACYTTTLGAEQRLEALRQVAALRHVTDAVLVRLVASFTPEEVRTLGSTSLVDLVIAHTGASPARAKTETTLAAALSAPPVHPAPEAPAEPAKPDEQNPPDGTDGPDGPDGAGRGTDPAAGAAGPSAGSSAVALGLLGVAHVAGQVSTDVAALAQRTVADLPARVRRASCAVADAALTQALPGLSYAQAQLVCDVVAHQLDPERADRGFDPDDLERRRLHLTVHADGWVDLHGRFDPVVGAAIKAALDHFSQPDPTVRAPLAPEHPTTDGTDGTDGTESTESTDGTDGTDGTEGAPDSLGGDADSSTEQASGQATGGQASSVPVRDERTAAQRRADALATLVRQGLGNTDGRGGEGARVVLTGTAAQLAGEPGAGQARCETTGRRVSRAQLLHLACSGVVQALRMSCDGPHAAVLSLGRAVRLFTASQRRAMLARDGGCVIPGCTAPPGWLEAHHVTEWAAGGPTDVDHGVLVCTRHHVLVTLGVWQIRMVAGAPQVRAPRAVDPLRRWVLNPRRALADSTVRAAEQLLLLVDPPAGWRQEAPDPPGSPGAQARAAPDIPSPHGTCDC